MKYIRAQTAASALQALLHENGKALIIAGGTDVVVDIQDGKRAPNVLVDISSALDMRGIAVEGNELVIGATVTFAEIVKSPIVKQYFPSICKAASKMGSTQIRNLATLAGNIVTANPEADVAMAIAPLAPKAVVLSESGTQTVLVENLYAGVGASRIDPSKEVIKEIRIPLSAPGDAVSYIRLALRNSLTPPILNVAAMLHYSEGKVEWARIAMGPVGIGPVRAKEAEMFLAGKPLTKENAAKAGELALKNADIVGNPIRGSIVYQAQVLPVLVRRALEDIAAQLGVV